MRSRGVSAGRRAPGDRGDLNANRHAISGTPVREEDWGLDPTGNWSDYAEKTSGSTDLDQDRTHNKVNEVTDITETTGTAWVTPAQDKNGNMTTVPKPSSPANGLTLKYDAWNGLVEVKDGATVVGKYEHDGLNRRAKRHVDSDSPGSPDGIDTYVHYFYNAGWQVLETRDTATESDQPENLQPDYQYVWSGRYIDAPILRDENTDQDSLCDDARLYYLTDANFNVTTLTDTSGDAVERYLYDPYGTPTIYDATWSNTRSTSSYNNTVLYTGREFDRETGLYYYRNRYYTAHLGRFTSRDPIAYQAGSSNLFQYLGSHVGSGVDPFGLRVVEDRGTHIVGDIELQAIMDAFARGAGAPEIGRFIGVGDWHTNSMRSRIVASYDAPSECPGTCKKYLALCTIDREALIVFGALIRTVVLGGLPPALQRFVDEYNRLVDWEESMHRMSLTMIQDHRQATMAAGCSEQSARSNACSLAMRNARRHERAALARMEAFNQQIDRRGQAWARSIRDRVMAALIQLEGPP